MTQAKQRKPRERNAGMSLLRKHFSFNEAWTDLAAAQEMIRLIIAQDNREVSQVAELNTLKAQGK